MIFRRPFVKIVEQPDGVRFRYKSDGGYAGTILGRSSTSVNKTYPTIQICGYQGEAKVVVQCVTEDFPYR